MIPCKKSALNSKKLQFLRKTKNWLFSNHCICHLVQCISMKLGTIVQWSFLVIRNKSARICLEVNRDSVIQSLKSVKTRKSGLFLCRGRNNLRIYSCYSLPYLKHDQKHLFRIPSLNVPKMRLLGTF